MRSFAKSALSALAVLAGLTVPLTAFADDKFDNQATEDTLALVMHAERIVFQLYSQAGTEWMEGGTATLIYLDKGSAYFLTAAHNFYFEMNDNCVIEMLPRLVRARGAGDAKTPSTFKCNNDETAKAPDPAGVRILVDGSQYKSTLVASLYSPRAYDLALLRVDELPDNILLDLEDSYKQSNIRISLRDPDKFKAIYSLFVGYPNFPRADGVEPKPFVRPMGGPNCLNPEKDNYRRSRISCGLRTDAIDYAKKWNKNRYNYHLDKAEAYYGFSGASIIRKEKDGKKIIGVLQGTGFPGAKVGTSCAKNKLTAEKKEECRYVFSTRLDNRRVWRMFLAAKSTKTKTLTSMHPTEISKRKLENMSDIEFLFSLRDLLPEKKEFLDDYFDEKFNMLLEKENSNDDADARIAAVYNTKMEKGIAAHLEKQANGALGQLAKENKLRFFIRELERRNLDDILHGKLRSFNNMILSAHISETTRFADARLIDTYVRQRDALETAAAFDESRAVTLARNDCGPMAGDVKVMYPGTPFAREIKSVLSGRNDASSDKETRAFAVKISATNSAISKLCGDDKNASYWAAIALAEDDTNLLASAIAARQHAESGNIDSARLYGQSLSHNVFDAGDDDQHDLEIASLVIGDDLKIHTAIGNEPIKQLQAALADPGS